VVGTAAVVDAAAAEAPAGATWVPVEHGPGRSRTPVDGTLAALAARHAAVLDRIGADGALTAVPALTPAAYQAVGYRRADDPAPRPWAAFRLDPTNPDGPPVARAPDVGLVELVQGVRGAAAAACAGWEFDEDATEAVTGHCPGTGEPTKTDKRFAYLPLPSLVPGRGGRLRVDLVRRVLVAGWAGFERQVAWLAPRLAGRPAGAGLILSPLAADDWVLGRYTATARAWASVVPVVLPGVPHRRGAAGAAVYRRAVALVAAALGQSGYPPALVAETEIDVSPAGFWPGLHRAKDYKRPDSIAHWTPAHVRLVFPRPVAGPLAVGAGRYVGFGVFAAE
jgi:CRISPR-associated protein Csb2